MEFRNLTPLHAMTFDAVDMQQNEFHVAVMRVGYRVVRRSGATGDEPTHTCELLEGDDALSLVMADEYDGEVNRSSVKFESDLAPFKPRCDVLVRATGYAPKGVPATTWGARFRAFDGPAKIIDKGLRLMGARSFRRGLLGWRAGPPAPCVEVPIRWEYAFGGASHVVQAASGKADGEPPMETVLNEVCFTNPLGSGWIEKRYLSLAGKKDVRCTSSVLETATSGERINEVRACQIEAWGHPISSVVVGEHPSGELDARRMAEVSSTYAATPVGLGPVGRAWTPRLQRAGTYDEAWQRDTWPYLPQDFDFRYWNGAPDDQQIAWPTQDFAFELVNLAAPEHTANGYLRARLPGHRAVTVLRFEHGAVAPIATRLDTILIDTEAMQVVLTWRAVFPANPPVRVCEMRFETDPRAPLLRLDHAVMQGDREEEASNG
ncbi:DUF2169 family type VI secretion system accessory protein [Burkholderia stagnalis]